MPTDQSVYSAFAAMLEKHHLPFSPAELQGFLLGRTCTGIPRDEGDWLAALDPLCDGGLPQELEPSIRGLQTMVREELEQPENIAVTLLLPDDETPMSVRMRGLSDWCQGFLMGFGVHVGDQSLNAAVTEILEDMTAVAQMDEGGDEEAESEDDYMQVVEYLRVAPMLILGEVRPAAPVAEAEKPDTPSLH